MVYFGWSAIACFLHGSFGVLKPYAPETGSLSARTHRESDSNVNWTLQVAGREKATLASRFSSCAMLD